MERANHYIDTHAHLAMLEHAPLDEILKRAKLAGVERIVTVSTDEGSWESNRNLALQHTHIFYTLGIHPHDAKIWPQCAANLEALVKDGVPEKCVAIGEIGLDFHYDLSPREIQVDVFRSQLELAKRLKLPTVIHCRDAFSELFQSLRDIGPSERGGVMHCFTGDPAQAKQAVDLGLKVSFSGIATFRNADPIRQAAKAIPTSAILLETDCPFLAPVPMRGKPNEPSFLPHTALVLSDVLSVSLEEVARLTTKNAIEFFRIPKLTEGS